ncbi:hypothetical protein [Robiginitalea sp. IMCC43444]|uniref:hypothetical protein n=1 Tax=Robiginitalea sp. IMCC43444 TaxID=3459121 RepID=UPI004042F282
METIKRYLIAGLMVGSLLTCLLQSCSTDADEQEIAVEDQLTQQELQTVLETDQWTAVADTALAEIYQNGNSTSGKSAANECYQVVYSETGFTATFGNCMLNGTDNVNGTLVVTYSTNPDIASYTATFDGFFVGAIELNGTRTYTLVMGENQNSISLTVNSEMTVTLEDQSTIIESGTKTLTVTFGETLSDISFSITGNWMLQVGENTYSVTILEPLNGNFECEYLLSGIMDLNKNGLEIEVDFGDGSCDDMAQLTYPNGAKENISL